MTEKNKREIIFCDCCYPGHNLVLEVVDWTYGNEEKSKKELMIFYRLNHYLNFWKRLYHAYKYVFQKDIRRIDYTDIVVSDKEELQKIKDMIDEVLNQ